jgi:hypothetical protein
MRGFGIGGGPRRSWAGPSTGGDENAAPPGGLTAATAASPPRHRAMPRAGPEHGGFRGGAAVGTEGTLVLGGGEPPQCAGDLHLLLLPPPQSRSIYILRIIVEAFQYNFFFTHGLMVMDNLTAL